MVVSASSWIDFSSRVSIESAGPWIGGPRLGRVRLFALNFEQEAAVAASARLT